MDAVAVWPCALIDPATQYFPASHSPEHVDVVCPASAAPNRPAAHFWFGSSGRVDPAAQKKPAVWHGFSVASLAVWPCALIDPATQYFPASHGFEVASLAVPPVVSTEPSTQ